MKCPNCQAPLEETTIEGRKRQTCKTCSYMHYKPRRVTGPYETLVDEIADGVAEKGAHITFAEALINLCFRSEPGGKSSDEKIREWASLHGFEFRGFIGKDGNRKPVHLIDFYRPRIDATAESPDTHPMSTKKKPFEPRMKKLVATLRKMDDAERTAFLLVEILRAQGDACLNRGKIESLMRKLGVKDEYDYDNIHIAMQNRADAILERKKPLENEI